jgi:hypothetical protein
MKPKKLMKAFPRGGSAYDSSVADDKGMDLRDYFAAAALVNVVHLHHQNDIARAAYAIADAMMRARDE